MSATGWIVRERARSLQRHVEFTDIVIVGGSLSAYAAAAGALQTNPELGVVVLDPHSPHEQSEDEEQLVSQWIWLPTVLPVIRQRIDAECPGLLQHARRKNDSWIWPQVVEDTSPRFHHYQTHATTWMRRWLDFGLVEVEPARSPGESCEALAVDTTGGLGTLVRPANGKTWRELLRAFLERQAHIRYQCRVRNAVAAEAGGYDLELGGGLCMGHLRARRALILGDGKIGTVALGPQEAPAVLWKHDHATHVSQLSQFVVDQGAAVRTLPLNQQLVGQAWSDHQLARQLDSLPAILVVDRNGRRVLDEHAPMTARARLQLHWDAAAREYPYQILFALWDQETYQTATRVLPTDPSLVSTADSVYALAALLSEHVAPDFATNLRVTLQRGGACGDTEGLKGRPNCREFAGTLLHAARLSAVQMDAQPALVVDAHGRVARAQPLSATDTHLRGLFAIGSTACQPFVSYLGGGMSGLPASHDLGMHLFAGDQAGAMGALESLH